MYEANLSGVFRLYRAALSRCWIPALVLALGGVAVAVAMERLLPPATGDIWQWSAQVRSVDVVGRTTGDCCCSAVRSRCCAMARSWP